MEDDSSAFDRADFKSICDKLIEAGWLDAAYFHSDRDDYGIKWTAKGRERAAQILELDDEIELGPKGLAYLILICKLHPPTGKPNQ